MKKLILIALVLFLGSMQSFADTFLHSNKCVVYYVNTDTWSEPVYREDYFVLDIDRATLYYNGQRSYYLYNAKVNKHDNKGGETYTYSATENNGSHCTIEFRIDPYGERQLYIRYSDYQFCFVVDDIRERD